MRLSLCFCPGHRGLEVCSHGGGPLVPVDLRDRVCGGNAGALPPAALPEPDLSHPAAQHRVLRTGWDMTRKAKPGIRMAQLILSIIQL